MKFFLTTSENFCRKFYFFSVLYITCKTLKKNKIQEGGRIENGWKEKGELHESVRIKWG
jgi:hypothetical protein